MNTDGLDPVAPEMPLAFDADNRLVAVTHPIYETPLEGQDDQPDKMTLADMMDVLLCGISSRDEVHARTVLIGYLLQSQFAPHTLDELGAALGITKQAAAKRLTTFKQKCQQILAGRAL